MKASRSAACSGACAALMLLSGCGSARVGEHVRAETYTGEPKRVVLVNAVDAAFSSVAAERFGTAAVQDLGNCGVTVMVIRPNSMELNGAARLRAAIASFKPDSILNMQQASSTSYRGSVVGGRYLLTLSDVATKTEVWKASINLAGGFIGAAGTGPKLSASIVQQMVADRLLSSCRLAPGQAT